MVMGKAIPSALEEGVLYDPYDPVAAWPFELMNVLKCPSCGHSINARELERIKIKNAERISCGDEPTTRG
jgi:hypothetical protein